MMDMAWTTRTPLRRALLLLLAPIWLPVAVVLVLGVGIIYVLLTLTWCPLVQGISWVLYSDRYVLGKWWWAYAPNLREQALHEGQTNNAREKLGMPRVF